MAPCIRPPPLSPHPPSPQPCANCGCSHGVNSSATAMAGTVGRFGGRATQVGLCSVRCRVTFCATRLTAPNGGAEKSVPFASSGARLIFICQIAQCSRMTYAAWRSCSTMVHPRACWISPNPPLWRLSLRWNMRPVTRWCMPSTRPTCGRPRRATTPLKHETKLTRGGCGVKLGLGYAVIPRLARYSTGLSEPREILMRFSLYQRM